MAYKTLLFGVDDMFGKLKPFYELAIRRGTLEVVAIAIFEQKGIRFVTIDGKPINTLPQLELAIISSRNDFYQRMKFLEARGVPRNRIIDGRVFQVPNLDFPRLINEGVAYGIIDNKNFFAAKSHTIYPQLYRFQNGSSILRVGAKSYLTYGNVIEGNGEVTVGKFSPIARGVTFAMGQNFTHNYRNVNTFGGDVADWQVPKEFYPPQGTCKIFVGNDVWIGRGSILKSMNPNKPLVIGDGAVVASDSVVVKNVPPYAIVGGNPAQIIKYRFEPEVIEGLQRIKWWDWSLDKIHDNFKYFNDPKKLISLHDK